MSIRHLVFASFLGLAALGAAHAPGAAARTYVDVRINVAPPPPRVERVIVRPGYVWVPGYWRWDDHVRRHVRVDGYYVHARPGYRYVPARWVHEGPAWRFHAGYWVH
ncbi:MAG: hypothetical protein ABFC67_15180 [Mizugakiibacter sp.]|uniref:hypothetical protein n=1 Tax=Mizugakiibacter sp. TaxID=1972610 RepID=UPI0031BFCC8B|nr:hypothetical protein [Xanthomonadaceae bacterium]